jgi:hypothetical protein
MRIVRYEKKWEGDWDAFVSSSKNGAFIHRRSYMEYHQERFSDFSLLVFDERELIAILPCHRKGNVAASHDGLTWAGLLVQNHIPIEIYLQAFSAALGYLFRHGIRTLSYKTVPFALSKSPALEEQYALFLAGANLSAMNTGFILNQREGYAPQKRRLRAVTKAQKLGVKVKETTNFRPFWQNVLVPTLQKRFKATPVHTLDEITGLHEKFPTQIRQFGASINGKIVAGVTTYDYGQTVRCQYIAATPAGKLLHALDLLFHTLITVTFREKEWFSFGTANQEGGKKINVGLAQWKQSFGSMLFVNSCYDVKTNAYKRILSALKTY